MKRLAISLVIIIASVFIFSNYSFAVEKYQFRTRGNNAYASFYSDTGCGYIYTDVYVTNERLQERGQKPESRPWAYISIYKDDWCVGTFTSLWGGKALEAGAFTFKQLNNATLLTTFDVEGDVCDWDWNCYSMGALSLQVDLTWTGVGDTNKGMYVENYRQHGARGSMYRYHSKSQGSWREASVSGSITDGGTNYAAGGQYASLGNWNNSSVTIYR